MPKRISQSLDKKPWKLLLWTAVAGLLFGLVGFGEIAEDYLRTVRNSLHQHKASGQIVLVTIDDAAHARIRQLALAADNLTPDWSIDLRRKAPSGSSSISISLTRPIRHETGVR